MSTRSQETATPKRGQKERKARSAEALSKMVPAGQRKMKRATPESQFQKAEVLEGDMAGGLQEGKWSKEEHKKFLEALEMYGNLWKLVENYIGTRTCGQIRSHAQKHFKKLRNRAYQELKRTNRLKNTVFIVTREFFCYQGLPTIPSSTTSASASASSAIAATDPNSSFGAQPSEDSKAPDSPSLTYENPYSSANSVPLPAATVVPTLSLDPEASWVPLPLNSPRENYFKPADWDSFMLTGPRPYDEYRSEDPIFETEPGDQQPETLVRQAEPEEFEIRALRRIHYEL
jgi:SHAQKYF class myb-like DNA-binding protein